MRITVLFYEVGCHACIKMALKLPCKIYTQNLSSIFSIKSRVPLHTNGLLRWRSTYFLTTPIFYVNAEPHIGHLYTSVLADALARFQRQKSRAVSIKFMTGTDEHGLKIHRAAVKNKLTDQQYCDIISEKYKIMCKEFSVDYTDFLRTTEQRHKDVVEWLWNRIKDNGHIYLGEYTGWYCVSDETFVPESQLSTPAADGSRVTLEGSKPVEFVKEQNYKFKLSSFQDDLLHWLKDEGVVRPAKFHKMLRDWVAEGSVLQDISVSRPAPRVSWGVPVPGDSAHLVYVWLDALASYLTASRSAPAVQWPPDLQIIGKDILKFHGVYWPAFLMAAGLAPPRQLLVHSHWTIDDEKMSKSKGNVVDPMERAAEYTADGLRYFLLREGVPHSDGNFTESKVRRVLNSELADTLGNLLSRCCGQLVNARQSFPGFDAGAHSRHCADAAAQLVAAVEALPETVCGHFDNMELYKGIEAIRGCLHLTNELFESQKPWELRKHAERRDHLEAVLHVTMETLRVCGILLYPIVPNISTHLLDKLGVEEDRRSLEDIRPLSWQRDGDATRPLKADKIVLFQRLAVAVK